MKLKKLLFVFFTLILNNVLFGQLDSIWIHCDTNLLQKMYSEYLENDYIECNVNYLGKTHPAHMRIRGSSSREFPKKSLKIKYKSDNKTKTINLNADYLDKSYMRQYLASSLYEQIHPLAFSCEHKAVFINNTFFGIYLEVDNIDYDFLIQKNKNDIGNLYKASTDYANMSWFDDGSNYWEKKTNKNHNNSDLQNLIYDINSISIDKFADYIKSNFNYNNLISSVALNILIGNGSTYYHNYYLYNNTWGHKWYYLPWDLDKTMGSYKDLRYDYCSWSAHESGDMPENPLIKKLFLNSSTSKEIFNKIDSLKLSIFNEEQLYPIIDSLENVLQPYIQHDDNDQITNIGRWKQEIQKIKKYITERPLEIQQQLQNTPTPFLMHNNYNQYFEDTVFLSWEPSYINEKKCTNYNLKISDTKYFNSDNNLFFNNLTDTVFKYQLKEGVYYWHLNALHEKEQINGYNSRSFFTVGRGVKLDSPIDKKVIIENKNIIIDKDIIIEDGGELIIKGKSTIHVYPNCQISNFGQLKLLGDKKNVINIKSKDERLFWSGIYSEGTLDIQHTNFSQIKGKSVIRQIGGQAIMKYCKASNNDVRETVSFNHCPVDISYNYFNNNSGEGILFLDCAGFAHNNTIVNINDAIEATKCQFMHIFDNFILRSGDDGIDINYGHQIYVYKNEIIDSKDKGISLTLDSMFQYNKISENIVSFNNTGVGLEGEGIAVLTKNTYTKNKNRFLIENAKKITILESHQKNNKLIIISIMIALIALIIILKKK